MAVRGTINANSAGPEQTGNIGRRHFLQGALASATGLAAPATTINPAPAASDALVAIAYEDGGISLASDFIGLSFESAALAAGEYFSPDNASLVSLIRLLGAARPSQWPGLTNPG